MTDDKVVPVEVAEQAVDEFADLVKNEYHRRVPIIGFGAFLIGALAGAAGGYFFCQHKMETKYNQIAEDEIAEMREHYQNKLVALENTATKDDPIEEIVREKGYAFPPSSVEPPMAVTPPTAVVEAAAEALEEEAPVIEAPVIQHRNVFEEARVVDHWDYHKEKAQRSPMKPYVIHIDEREATDYDEGTLTYYEIDDVLCNELDEVIGAGAERDLVIGEANLDKFGHGSNDAHIVYIRNDRLESQYEVVLSPNSYAEEVHGFDRPEAKPRRKTRWSRDDE